MFCFFMEDKIVFALSNSASYCILNKSMTCKQGWFISNNIK